MIVLAAALALQPQIVAPPPGYVSTDAPMPQAVATDPATAFELIKGTCWDHLLEPDRLQAEAERVGFNFFWVGSRRERRVGTGTGTLNYLDAGVINPRGSDRQCDIFMRVEPRDHDALATGLATTLALGASAPSPARPVSNWAPPTRETLWTVRNRDGTTLRVRLVSSQAARGGNVHIYITLYPKSASQRSRRGG